jgi:hypothetical protein
MRNLYSIPLDGSALTWTGEALFERAMPTAPKGKAWIGGGLVRVRRGSKRAGDVHPPQWWLMSTSARSSASADWKVKFAEILQAPNRRGISREALETMPPSTTVVTHSHDVAAAVLFLRSNGTAPHEKAEWLWPPAMACNTTDLEDFDDDPLPTLEDESSDEDADDHAETHSSCSSTDDYRNVENFFTDHFNAANLTSTEAESGESGDDKTQDSIQSIPCAVCHKPKWCRWLSAST